MKLFDRRTLLARLTGNPSLVPTEPLARWSAVAQADERLIGDVIRLGGVLSHAPEPSDAIELARREGRRELALTLLALMAIDPQEFANLTRRNEDE